MVVRLRLARWGQRNRPFYRIVATDSRSPRDGRYIELIGAYNPLPHSRHEARSRIKRVYLNVDRIKYWLSVGAQPSDTVARLLSTGGLLARPPRVVQPTPADFAAKIERRKVAAAARAESRSFSTVTNSVYPLSTHFLPPVDNLGLRGIVLAPSPRPGVFGRR